VPTFSLFCCNRNHGHFYAS